MKKQSTKREKEELAELVDPNDINDIEELRRLLLFYSKEMLKYKIRSEAWEELINVAESKGMQVREKASTKSHPKD